MQSIKFMSLIVICATSCLALLLPAIGVVPFPSQLSGVSNQTAGVPGPAEIGVGAGPMQHAPPAADPWGLGGGHQGVNQSGVAGVGMSGLPVSTSVPTNVSSAPSLVGTELHFGNSVAVESAAGQTAVGVGQSKYDTLGFGIWLLLVPIWFFALVVWSVTPSPRNRSK